MSDPQIPPGLAGSFREELNKHGYSFQEVVYREIADSKENHHWTAWAPELPVGAESTNTRIDLILTSPGENIFLVCECKRVNPSLANWCFVRSAFLPPHGDIDIRRSAYAELLQPVQLHGKEVYRTRICRIHSNARIYQRGLEVKVKSSESGEDGPGKGRGQIEEAATQVCKGLNGLIEFFMEHSALIAGKDAICVVPVIFTTACLWSSRIDLSKSNLKDGKFENEVDMHEEAWLWYHYPQSKVLKHSVEPQSRPTNIAQILYADFVRPIAIVNSRSISTFLKEITVIGPGADWLRP